MNAQAATQWVPGNPEEFLGGDGCFEPGIRDTSSTFLDNTVLPVHRWFRYAAGFSAKWVEQLITEEKARGPVRVLDPFMGCGTTLIAAECSGVESVGLEAHPFVFRVAKAKLAWRSGSAAYLQKVDDFKRAASQETASLDHYPELIRRCYDNERLARLDTFRRAYERVKDDDPASDLLWLTLVGMLRQVSVAGTAQWQYVLPKKRKKAPRDPERAFHDLSGLIARDMGRGDQFTGAPGKVLLADARDCRGVEDASANLVITSPPYPNNFDYADATRLEMCFVGEISGWSDLQEAVRRYLVRSCTQHVPNRAVDLQEVLDDNWVAPIRDELARVCARLGEVRETKGGRKTYHLMVATYFLDLAKTWGALRRCCDSPSTVCMVIGDSAPYGVYVPVVPWLGKLALAAGFHSFSFEKTRDRNVKWKNRKHRVPLQEGRLWVKG